MAILAAGAGASEGLDDVFKRMLLQGQAGETVRHNQAEEGLQGRQLDQLDTERSSTAEERAARSAAIRAEMENEASRKKGYDSLMEEWTGAPPDLSTPNGRTMAYMRLRPLIPKGEPFPYQILEDPAAKVAAPVHGEAKDYELTDPTIAQSLGKKVGDTIPATFHPDTGGLTFPDATGKAIDVTRGVKPKQPPPMFMPIQTGDTYGSFNRRAGTEAPMQGPGGAPVPLATTGATRTMGEGAKMLRPHIQELSGMADQLDKAGLFGPVMSRVRNLATKVGSIDDFYDSVSSDPELKKLDPLAGEFATSLGLLATGAGRVHGGARGGGSPQMYQHFKDMLSDASTPEMFKGRLNAVDKYMGTYAAGPGGAAAPSDTGPVDLIYDPATKTFKKPGD